MIYFNKLSDICINRQERKVVDNYDVRSKGKCASIDKSKFAHFLRFLKLKNEYSIFSTFRA